MSRLHVSRRPASTYRLQLHGGFRFANARDLVPYLAQLGVTECYSSPHFKAHPGTELWDLSLVDPDNRRSVDFARRRTLLDGLRPVIERIEAGGTAEREVAALLERWSDGAIKLLVTASGLRFRREHAALMLGGSYVPVESHGAAAEHLVALARHDESGTLLAIVPRLVASLVSEPRPSPLGPDAWASTRVLLPEGIRAPSYRHLLTGETVDVLGSHLLAASVFRTSPVALLWAPVRANEAERDAA